MKKKKKKYKINEEWIHPGVLNQRPQGESSLDSLDVPLKDGDGDLTGDTLLDTLEQPDPNGLANYERLQNIVLSYAKNEKNKKILQLWMDGYTYEEIGKEMKLVRQRVEQVVNEVIKKLNKPHIAKSILKGDYKL